MTLAGVGNGLHNFNGVSLKLGCFRSADRTHIRDNLGHNINAPKVHAPPFSGTAQGNTNSSFNTCANYLARS